MKCTVLFPDSPDGRAAWTKRPESQSSWASAPCGATHWIGRWALAITATPPGMTEPRPRLRFGTGGPNTALQPLVPNSVRYFCCPASVSLVSCRPWISAGAPRTASNCVLSAVILEEAKRDQATGPGCSASPSVFDGGGLCFG